MHTKVLRVTSEVVTMATPSSRTRTSLTIPLSTAELVTSLLYRNRCITFRLCPIRLAMSHLHEGATTALRSKCQNYALAVNLRSISARLMEIVYYYQRSCLDQFTGRLTTCLLVCNCILVPLVTASVSHVRTPFSASHELNDGERSGRNRSRGTLLYGCRLSKCRHELKWRPTRWSAIREN